jgi:hypothetical protein
MGGSCFAGLVQPNFFCGCAALECRLRLFRRWRRDLLINAVGLDAAGKTTILYKLKLGEIVTTIPTIGKFFFFPLATFDNLCACIILCPCPFCVDLKLWFRLQRGDGGVQEHQLHRVGRWRAGQDPPALAPLLPEHTGVHAGAAQTCLI